MNRPKRPMAMTVECLGELRKGMRAMITDCADFDPTTRKVTGRRKTKEFVVTEDLLNGGPLKIRPV